jgi:hypothetical protein
MAWDGNWRSPSDFYEPWEETIVDWPSALKAIDNVFATATPLRKLAWRGVINAHYPLHSSLYRRVSGNGAFPFDASVIALEEKVLRHARRKWRFDHLCALEIFAQIQHLGGATRLLDVSLNPFIALWFAVEQKYDLGGIALADEPGRLFVFDVSNREIELDELWGSRDLPWSVVARQDQISRGDHRLNGWSTDLPWIWRPPSYNERIFAQNAAFLIGGVPTMSVPGQNSHYRKTPGNYSVKNKSWNATEVRQTTSVSLTMSQLGNTLRGGTQRQSTPTFTLKIAAEAKKQIREDLGRRMGLDPWTVYPDLLGLSQLAINIL